MTRGFDANVPARKPQTISRVLSELTAVPENGKPAAGIEPTPPPAAPKQGRRATRGKSGRERIATLRERLAMTAHGSAGEAEPQQTATAVRELIDLLRAKLESSIEERSRLAGELEEARAALARSEAELKKERRARTSLEAQAEERRRIADEAVAEAELADLDARLQEALSGRARAEARSRELTSEVERLSAAGAALEALESLVRRNR